MKALPVRFVLLWHRLQKGMHIGRVKAHEKLGQIVASRDEK